MGAATLPPVFDLLLWATEVFFRDEAGAELGAAARGTTTPNLEIQWFC